MQLSFFGKNFTSFINTSSLVGTLGNDYRVLKFLLKAMCLVVPSVKRRVKKLGHSTAGLNFTLLFTMSLGGFLTFQHCVKRVRISSYYGPYFLAFGLNTERYEVKIVRIRSYSGPYSVRMRKNADQNKSEYGHFSRSAKLFQSL